MKNGEKRQAGDIAYRAIRLGILQGRYAPGSHLKETLLSAELGVSRTPIREALRRLHAEGLVGFSPNIGAMVTRWSIEDIEELFALRAMLESHAAERAAARITDRQLDDLEEVSQAMNPRRKPGLHPTYLAVLNQKFHAIIREASGSIRLGGLLASVVEVPVMLMASIGATGNDLDRSFFQHQELITALRARDAQWTATLMRAHIMAARQAYIDRSGTRDHGAILPPGGAASVPILSDIAYEENDPSLPTSKNRNILKRG